MLTPLRTHPTLKYSLCITCGYLNNAQAHLLRGQLLIDSAVDEKGLRAALPSLRKAFSLSHTLESAQCSRQYTEYY